MVAVSRPRSQTSSVPSGLSFHERPEIIEAVNTVVKNRIIDVLAGYRVPVPGIVPQSAFQLENRRPIHGIQPGVQVFTLLDLRRVLLRIKGPQVDFPSSCLDIAQANSPV